MLKRKVFGLFSKSHGNPSTSLSCLYESDIDMAGKYIDSLMLHPLPADFGQFKKDCDYYYSRILNVPIIPPEVLQLDFMRRCQLQCRICKIWSNQRTRPEEELTYEELKEIFDQAADLKISQCYFSGGEPFMLEYLFDILAYAKNKKMFTEVTTNGLLLSQENCRKLIAIPVSQINISIDGASAETHDYHRNRPGLFNEVISNVQRFSQLKKTREGPHPFIIMTFVVTNRNFHEMLKYVNLAQSVGAIAFFQPYSSENDNYYHKTIVDEFVIPQNRVKALCREVDKVIKHKIKFDNPRVISNSVYSLENIKKYFSNNLTPASYCFAGFNRITVLKDRRIDICPGQIGNLKEGTLRDIWFSSQAQLMRQKILNCSKPCLFGSAYQPGPSVNDIFLIVKRHLIYLQKNNMCNSSSLDKIIIWMENYKGQLSQKALSQEEEKNEIVLKYLSNLKGAV